MNTGSIIKNLRKRRGISAERLAEMIGVAPSTIYRYENGEIEKMPYTVLTPIANALGTTPMYLLGFEEDAKEDLLVNLFRMLDEGQQDAILSILKKMVE